MSDKPARTIDHKDLPYIVTVEDETNHDGIRIYDLTVKTPGHNPVTLLDSQSLHLQKGRRYVVTGDSGSGKTLTANAILGLHTDGSGLIVTPAGLKVMPMSQTPYFSSTNITGVLNMRPTGKHQFNNKELADVLMRVGLDRLIEQVPGEGPRLLINALAAQAPDLLKPFAGTQVTHKIVNDIYDGLSVFITDYIAKNFRTVQYMTATQEDNLRETLKTVMVKANVPISQDRLTELSDKLIAKIDADLTTPAYNHLLPFLKDTVRQQRGKIVPYTVSKGAFYANRFEKALTKRLARYLANEDTDDKIREIRLNAVQTAHLTKTLTASLRSEFNRYAIGGEKIHSDVSLCPTKPVLSNWNWPGKLLKKFEDAARGTSLSKVFQAVTWPLSIPFLWMRANKASREMTQNLGFFMARQITTGDNLTLSGGERQKLTVAQILLHKPDVLFMDEITAALNQETAEKLYREIIAHTNKDTIMFSIAHNNYVIKYHTDHLHLTGKKFKAREITEEEKNGNPPPAPPAPPAP